MVTIPPFYSNTKDNTHCYQAVLKMILAANTGKKYTWKKLDQITGKDPDKWTWPMIGLIHMKNIGYDVISIGSFDYGRFLKEGKKYLVFRSGVYIANEQVKHSNIKKAQKEASIYLQSDINIKRNAVTKDIKKYIDDGYYVVPNINAKTLSKKEGYSGHFVLIYKYTEKSVIVHDPGLPGRPSRKISWETFISAWAYPNKTSCRIYAFKYTL